MLSPRTGYDRESIQEWSCLILNQDYFTLELGLFVFIVFSVTILVDSFIGSLFGGLLLGGGFVFGFRVALGREQEAWGIFLEVDYRFCKSLHLISNNIIKRIGTVDQPKLALTAYRHADKLPSNKILTLLIINIFNDE